MDGKAKPRPAVAEALRLAELMMRDSWATGSDEAWQPAREELRKHLETMLDVERESAARTRVPKPRILPPMGSGGLHGEQQHCFALGWKEGAAALRRAIRNATPG
jgi:hypothetical protein